MILATEANRSMKARRKEAEGDGNTRTKRMRLVKPETKKG